MLVDVSKINIDFENTTVFMKDSANSSQLTSGNRRFQVIGTAQPAYGNYVWYRCNAVPFNRYAFDSLGTYMPNNSEWFLGYQRERLKERKATNHPKIDILANPNVKSDEIFALVKNGVLYLSIKSATSTLSGVSGFSICRLPIDYRPMIDVNVLFYSILGKVFFGSVSSEGEIAVNINGDTSPLYLYIAIPVHD